MNATEEQENKKDGEVEELSSTAAKDQEGGAEVLCLAAALDKESEEGVQLGATRGQELFSVPLGEADMDQCTVYTNKQVEY